MKAITLLTIVYSKVITSRMNLSLLMGLIIVLLYGYMFFILQLEDYSLLIGTGGLFFILSLLMFLTRKIQWNGVNKKE
jgi:inner membrane protein